MVCNLFHYISIALNFSYNKNKQYKTLDYFFNFRSIDMHNFNFPENGLGLVYPSHFVYDFSRKTFFMLYSIDSPNFIV